MTDRMKTLIKDWRNLSLRHKFLIGGCTAIAGLVGLGAITGGDDSDGESNVSPREAAEFIWDKEADDLDFCLLYWRLPYVEVVEDVFLVRAAGMSDPDAVADELASLASLRCPQPAGWTEDWIESQR